MAKAKGTPALMIDRAEVYREEIETTAATIDGLCAVLKLALKDSDIDLQRIVRTTIDALSGISAYNRRMLLETRLMTDPPFENADNIKESIGNILERLKSDVNGFGRRSDS